MLLNRVYPMRSNQKPVTRSSPAKRRKSTKNKSLSIAELCQSDEEKVANSPKKRPEKSKDIQNDMGKIHTRSPKNQTRKSTGAQNDTSEELVITGSSKKRMIGTRSDIGQAKTHNSSPGKRTRKSLGNRSDVDQTVTHSGSPEKQKRKLPGTRSDVGQTKTNADSPGMRTRNSPENQSDLDQTVSNSKSPKKRKHKTTVVGSDTEHVVEWNSPEEVEEDERRLRKRKGKL